MELQNNQKGEKAVITNQTVAAITPANLPAEPVDDLELNEEQLDIISGGGDGSTIIIRG